MATDVFYDYCGVTSLHVHDLQEFYIIILAGDKYMYLVTIIFIQFVTIIFIHLDIYVTFYTIFI